MKTIGLIGGMSWESTLPYYRLINEGVKQRLGCTEIGLLIQAADAPVPLFDTTALHAASAVEFALGGT